MDLAEPNMPEKEDHEYRYAIFEPLPDINITSNKTTSMPAVTTTSVDAKNYNCVLVDCNESNEIH